MNRHPEGQLSPSELSTTFRILRGQGHTPQKAASLVWPHPASECETCYAEQQSMCAYCDIEPRPKGQIFCAACKAEHSPIPSSRPLLGYEHPGAL